MSKTQKSEIRDQSPVTDKSGCRQVGKVRNQRSEIFCLLCSLFCLLFLVGCKREPPTPPSYEEVVLSMATDRDSLPADGLSSLVCTTRVKYTNGTPAQGLEVKFHTTLGKITARDTTDSDGKVTATLVSDTIVGTSKITAYCLQNSNSINIPFYSVAQDIYIESLTANPNIIPADGISHSNISAIFKHTTGEPAPDLIVSFSAALGTIIPYDTTDSNGLATSVLTSATTPGTSMVRAWYGLAKDSINVIFSEEAGGDTIPASIVIYSADPLAISVHGSGGNETSTLIFQVRDSSGIPVSGSHTVNFYIEQGPGGGEYLYPVSTSTQVLALATTHLNSGTISGPVKVRAQLADTNIFSAPVEIVILGGPPHQDHFTVVTEKLNLYALWYAGVQDIITAFVGDIYGNPVPDSTVVWFTTPCGIIQPGSGWTIQGEMSNTLVSCAPWPSNGLFYVDGWTIDVNGNAIKDSTRVLWSGDPILTLIPTTFSIPNVGSENFTFRMRDQNGNPLTEGATYSVSVDVGKLYGQTSFTLWDTQDPLLTEFYFSLHDDAPDTVNARISELTVEFSGPDYASKTIKILGTIE